MEESKAPKGISSKVLAMRAHFKAIPDLSLKHFTVGATLGTGTFGRVRLVTHPVKNASDIQHFALKMMKKSEIIRLKQVEHIWSERDILLRIGYPFIVDFYGTFQDDDNVYMIMEFVVGGELFSQLRQRGRFSNDVARFFAAEIVCSLECLHSNDIIYRDLKPENLLIGVDGHVKITDFGFAKVVSDRTWTLCGTPEYLAPEIIQSKGHGKAVDWWALGILIFEMIAGYPPFYDENQFAIYQRILQGRIDFPRHFDVHAKDLVRKLLQQDRSQRIGCWKDGAEDVKAHSWFRNIDWSNVEKRKLTTSMTPSVSGANDTSLFDEYPDSDDDYTIPLKTADQDLFSDF